MTAYVKDIHANKQISIISDLVALNMPAQQICAKLTEHGFKNKANPEGIWKEEDIIKLIARFQLDTTEEFRDSQNRITLDPKSKPDDQRVTITNVQIPFIPLVVLMSKCILAAIPAIILAAIIIVLIFTAFSGLLVSSDIFIRSIR